MGPGFESQRSQFLSVRAMACLVVPISAVIIAYSECIRSCTIAVRCHLFPVFDYLTSQYTAQRAFIRFRFALRRFVVGARRPLFTKITFKYELIGCQLR